MEVIIKDAIYVRSDAQVHLVRGGTRGIEQNNVIWFADVTGSINVGFTKDFCTETPQMFSVSKTPADREVSLRGVLKVVAESVDGDTRDMLFNKFQQL